MRRRVRLRAASAFLICLAPAIARAHAFGAAYTPPVPFWMYAYGCAATLIVTFAILVYFLRDPARPAPVARPRAWRFPRPLLLLLRAGAAACLILTIVAGFAGTEDPDRNIAMTMFWALFLLGLAYLTLLVGDLYAVVNPWRTTIDLLERLGFNLSTARLDYPGWLGSWPAFLLYVALICLELFSAGTPAILSRALVIYSILTLAGAALFGADTYFAKMDVFAVYFRTIGRLAPIEHRRTDEGGWSARLRTPVAGVLSDTPSDAGLVVFVLFMLSSTAYDSIHNTQLWTGLFWKTALSLFLPLWGGDLGRAQHVLMGAFLAYRWAGLVVFPFLYLGLYGAALSLARCLAPTAPPVRQAAYVFCYSLVPIAVAYSFAHYFSFLAEQLRNFPSLVSDPFGLGWNLFGPAPPRAPPPLSMGLIWHVEVGAILTGHVVSVFFAHVMALRVFADRRSVVVGQLSLLALMVVYTIFGLWILSLPLG